MIRSFTAFKPAKRYDGVPFTYVVVQESSDTITWADIDTINFSDPDADPSNPQARNFTTTQATLDSGYYRLRWLDASTGIFVSDPVHYVPADEAPDVDWAPTVMDVASLDNARTYNDMGVYAGVFTNETRPTATAVQDLIGQATAAVSAEVGKNICNEELQDRAKSMAAIYTAMLIEVGYFPEQINRDQSPFNSWQSMWSDGIGKLKEDVSYQCGGIDTEGEGLQPAGNFGPPPNIGILGPIW